MIVAQADGYAPVIETIDITAGVSHGPIPIRLTKAGVLRGLVFGADGARLADATLSIEYGADVPFGRTVASFLSHRTPADQEFDFEVRNIVPGAALNVIARHDGRESLPMTVVLAAGESRSVVLNLQ